MLQGWSGVEWYVYYSYEYHETNKQKQGTVKKRANL